MQTEISLKEDSPVKMDISALGKRLKGTDGLTSVFKDS